jgi:hypothetical protein
VGDRAVFGFRDRENDDATVWLYSHWGGDSQNTTLAEALLHAGPRWNDPSYATRIAISRIIGTDWNNEVNFGLYATARHGESHGGEYRYINLVLWGERRVALVDVDDDSKVLAEVEFDDFIRDPEGAAASLEQQYRYI